MPGYCWVQKFTPPMRFEWEKAKRVMILQLIYKHQSFKILHIKYGRVLYQDYNSKHEPKSRKKQFEFFWILVPDTPDLM